MPDVFVSYARSSEPQAKAAAEALRSRGYSVWVDDELPAHRAYAEVIEEQLQSAKAVLVIWSEEAARSQWVRAEADWARNACKLVQMSADGTLPPMPFNQVQCADLKGWNGNTNRPGWKKIESSVAALVRGEGQTDQERVAARPRKDSICVLPFVNMSGDSEQEYFSDGISEDITTDLSKVSALAVTARNTAFMFKGLAVDVTDVARKLGVSHVLEGSVRKAGGRVRISAQLIDGASGDHIWAERFDRDLTDIFAIQDDISKAIVEALRLKLLPDEKKAIEQRCTCNADAYNLYLMARQYWISGNHGDPRREERTERICARAVELDPGYARAWALMALAQATLRFGYNRPGDGGIAAAERALSLDPRIAEAHCPMARLLAEDGRLEEANERIAIALRLDPDSWEVNKEAGRLCMMQKRIAEAKVHYERAVSVMESDFHAWGMLITCSDALGDKTGMHRAAEMVLEQSGKALTDDPSNGAALGLSAAALVVLGERERAMEQMERALLIDPDNLNMRYNFACALAQDGDPDAAMDMLGPVFERGNGLVIKLASSDPDFDGFRDTPRFQKMLRDAMKRVGIEPAAPANPPAAAEPLRS